jgi:hypothetical protein
MEEAAKMPPFKELLKHDQVEGCAVAYGCPCVFAGFAFDGPKSVVLSGGGHGAIWKVLTNFRSRRRLAVPFL